MTEIVSNVADRRHAWIGTWECDAINHLFLGPSDLGRTVIYRDGSGKTEAGTLSSWNGRTLFARYSTGSTAAGADVRDLVWGLWPLDEHNPARDIMEEGFEIEGAEWVAITTIGSSYDEELDTSRVHGHTRHRPKAFGPNDSVHPWRKGPAPK